MTKKELRDRLYNIRSTLMYLNVNTQSELHKKALDDCIYSLIDITKSLHTK